MRKVPVWVFGLAFVAMDVSAAEVGLITVLTGKVKLLEDKATAIELKPFVKIRDGDRLTLEGASRLQLVFFDGGRQETWQGAGALDVGIRESKVVKGNLQPEVKTLPPILVKQLSKTPAAEGNVKAGMVRMRSIPPPVPTLETAEKNYAELRQQADAADSSPELFLLASYFELREFDRINALLKQMSEKKPGDANVKALQEHYTAAIQSKRAEPPK